ncbi:VPS51 (YKR020W) [Zygosaccharomyces parabailii]|nr:VPS51 (YKR020W) [Zygosaccharomyces parabailii]
MAQQISHKKSLKRVNRERRAQLKEYYKLEAPNETDNSSKDSYESFLAPAVVITHSKDQKPPQEDQHIKEPKFPDQDQPIEQMNFKDLVSMHNRLLRKETETNNSIKNTIYENYYDLIKVNDLLKSMTGANQEELARLKDAVKLLQN